MRGDDLVEELRFGGFAVGDLLALVVAPDIAGVAVAGTAAMVAGRSLGGGAEAVAALAALEEALRPRWVVWSHATVIPLVAAGLRPARAWDLAAVHRLLFGGWLADPATIWATLHALDLGAAPVDRPPDLFSQAEGDDDSIDPVRRDGYLRADWVGGAWAVTDPRREAWAALAVRVAGLQTDRLAESFDPHRAEATVRSESTAELLCAELTVDGLPLQRTAAEAIVAEFIGPRPRSDAEAATLRDQRDALVLHHAPAGSRYDLRSPGQVKALLRGVGIEVPDTRAWRLEQLRDQHPLVEALLVWRKAERVATTYGYGWIDEHVGDDDRLRGDWSGSDGAAGRMTASAGLHNMPADMRGAVIAEPGHVFVRADLGQIEPRVLAAVSGDAALARATQEDDMYVPVATELGVDRATAKVAVLGAMYGQTTGHGATALRGLNSAYPVAMAYLEAADRAAQVGQDLRTYGGRLVRMSSSNISDVSDRDARSRAAARGRYGRNAMVQGAAAEFFKVWAVTVRARAASSGARIVLCLHDELVVHVPIGRGAEVARLLDECLQEAVHRWAPDRSVRFLAETTVIGRWSDAKD